MLERAFARASAGSVSQRVALIGGAAAFVIVAVGAAMSPSPAADAAQSSPQQLLDPQALVPAVTYTGGARPPAAELAHAEDPNLARASGRIGPDLTKALQAAGVPERIGREYVRLLARAIPLANELSVEDKFDLIFERGDEGRLLFAGLDRVARADVALLKWTDGRQTLWINADGQWGGSGTLRMPVSGRVTSRFGSRFHPILGFARMHRGIDLGAPAGSPIVAAAEGRVVSAGWAGGYGRQVAIAHAGGIRTTYSHMSRIAARPGDTVRQGQVIGYVGSSGLSTGPHLHYEVYKNGRPVNPTSVKAVAAGPAQLDGEKLHEFRGELRRLLLLPSAG